MRNISFALTTPQVLDRSKDVTRRMGWLKLKAGDQLQPVRKCMGLKPGEKVEKLGPPITVVSVRRERLDDMSNAASGYGLEECRREGFPAMTPAMFVGMFAGSHKGCNANTVITRIEFTYGEQA